MNMSTTLGLFSGLKDFIWEIVIVIAVVSIIIAIIKSQHGKFVLSVILTIGIIAMTAYSFIQVNYYYNATGGIYGHLVGMLDKNTVKVVDNVSYEFNNIELLQSSDDTYTAEILSNEVLLLDDDKDLDVFVNGMPCSYTYLTSDYLISTYNYSFFDNDMTLLCNDTLTFRFAFYTNSTYLSITTNGGADAVKYWNYYFNKNTFIVTVGSTDYLSNNELKTTNGDTSNYAMATFVINDEVYTKEIYKVGSAVVLPELDDDNFLGWSLTAHGAIVDNFQITENTTLYYIPVYKTITLNLTFKKSMGMPSWQTIDVLSTDSYSRSLDYSVSSVDTDGEYTITESEEDITVSWTNATYIKIEFFSSNVILV